MVHRQCRFRYFWTAQSCWLELQNSRQWNSLSGTQTIQDQTQRTIEPLSRTKICSPLSPRRHSRDIGVLQNCSRWPKKMWLQRKWHLLLLHNSTQTRLGTRPTRTGWGITCVWLNRMDACPPSCHQVPLPSPRRIYSRSRFEEAQTRWPLNTLQRKLQTIGGSPAPQEGSILSCHGTVKARTSQR